MIMPGLASPQLAAEQLVRLLSLIASACLFCSSSVIATAVDVRIKCDIQFCEGQFSERGQRICLAKELVHSLQSAALGCPDLIKSKKIYGSPPCYPDSTWILLQQMPPDH